MKILYLSKSEEKEIFIEPSRDFGAQLAIVKDLVSYKKNVSIRIRNFEGYFKIDLWFTLEQEMRGLQNISTISFEKCALTKNHLKILKGFVLSAGNRFLRLIFSYNNLSDSEMDYFIFGNGEAILKNIESSYLSIYIINNFGIFKELFISKLIGKVKEFVVIQKHKGIISFNERGGEENLYKSSSFFRLCFQKCFRQSIMSYGEETNDASQNNKVKAISMTQMNEEELEEDAEADKTERSFEVVLDILLAQDQVNSVEKIDLGFLNIKNKNLLAKLWREFIACSSLRSAELDHLESFITHSLAFALGKSLTLHLQKVNFQSSKFKPTSFITIIQRISPEVLNLSDCGLSDAHLSNIHRLHKFNKHFHGKLINLNLSNNHSIGIQGMKELGQMLLRCSALKELKINACGLTDILLISLIGEKEKEDESAGLELNCKLQQCFEKLEIRDNQQLTEKGYKKLFGWLSKFSKFDSIDLHNNNLNSKSVICLSEHSLLKEKIKSLVLSSNKSINAQNWETLFEVLAESQSLTSLNLEDCALDDDKISSIFQSLIGMNSTLFNRIERISLAGNNFSSQESHLAISSFLLKCQKLTFFDLSNLSLANSSLSLVLGQADNFLATLDTLTLSGNQDLTVSAWTTIFSKLKELDTLKHLNLSKCRITPAVCKGIRAQLGEKCYLYRSLSSLNISFNPEIRDGWQQFAECLRHFDRLVSLDLCQTIYSNSDIQGLLKAFIQPQLKKEISQQDNSPSILNRNPLKSCLKNLNFSMNTALNSQGWDYFWQFLALFETLEQLDMSNCFLEESKVKSLTQTLSGTNIQRTLKKLSLYGNSFLNIEGWKYVFNGLSEFTVLSKINLSFCYLTSEKVSALAKIISSPASVLKHSLKRISLNGCDKIGWSGYQNLLECVTGREKPLKIDLDKKANNSSGEQITESCYEDMKDHLFTINTLPQELEKLHLDRNIRITPSELGHLFRHISMYKGITEISLQKCYLTDQKIYQIIAPFSKNYSKNLVESLESINLSGNAKITNSGWARLFDCLGSFSNLRQISLSDCNLSDQQVNILSKSIRDSSKLLHNISELDLSQNQNINGPSFQSLFLVLAQSTLNVLILSNCNLNEKKMKAITLPLMGSNLMTTLETLDLDNNPKVPLKSWKNLFKALSTAKNLMNLSLQFCAMDNEKLTFLQNMFSKEKSELKNTFKSLKLFCSLRISEEVWLNLFKSLSQFSYLETLGLEFCSLKEQSCNKLLECFTNQCDIVNVITSLKNLNLMGNNLINEAGWGSIFKLIASLKSLEILNLSLCDLNDSKLRNITEIIDPQSSDISNSLQKLSLSFNEHIEIKGWTKIFQLISHFKKLTGLGLTKSSQTDQSIEIMCKKFRETGIVGRGLRKLQISQNPKISKVGLSNLVEFLKDECNQIEKVDLDEGGWDEEALQQISKQISGSQITSQRDKGKLMSSPSNVQISKIGSNLMRSKDTNMGQVISHLMSKQSMERKKGNDQKADMKKKFTLQMSIREQKFMVINKLPKSISKAVSKLNRYFQEARNIRLEKNVLTNGIIYKLGNFPPEMFGTHFLKYLVEDKKILCFSTKGLRQLTRIFAYNLPDDQIEPYPYRIMLNKINKQYLSKQIKEIYILNNSYDSECEKVTYPFLKELYLQYNETPINQIHIDYDFNNQIFESIMNEGGEKYLWQFVQLLPPKRVSFDGRMTLPCWKAIYSVLWYSYNIESVNMSYDINSVANLGIAFSWREHIYYNYKPQSILGRFAKKLSYKFLSIFVKESVKYEFHHDIQLLNDQLSQKSRILWLLLLLAVLYYFIALGAPIFVTQIIFEYQEEEICSSGVPIYSHYIYICFAIVSALVELYLFVFVTNRIGHLLPNPMDMKDYDETKEYSKLEKLVFRIKGSFKNKKTLFFSIAFVQSQLSKYDMYNDMCFVLVCFACQYQAIGIIGSFILIINIVICLKNIISTLRHMKKRNSRAYSSSSINSFYEVASLLECVALADVLDFVAPFNVWGIPNNKLARFFFPNLAGKSLSSKIFKACNKFLFEDTPQLILSVVFAFESSSGSINYNTIVAICSGILNLALSTYMFLSIRPSTITQLDFNHLTSLKGKNYKTKALEMLEIERNQIQEWRNHYEENKCISLDMIPQETGEMILVPKSKSNRHLSNLIHINKK